MQRNLQTCATAILGHYRPMNSSAQNDMTARDLTDVKSRFANTPFVELSAGSVSCRVVVLFNLFNRVPLIESLCHHVSNLSLDMLDGHTNKKAAPGLELLFDVWALKGRDGDQNPPPPPPPLLPPLFPPPRMRRNDP